MTRRATQKTHTTIILGDVHCGAEDTAAVALAHEIIAAVQPDRVVQIGDLLDTWALSTHTKDPAKGCSLAEEIERAQALIAFWREHAGAIHVTEGNHDERLKRRLSEEADLASTHPGMRELLGLSKREWTPYREHVTFGTVSYTHDLGYSGMNAAAQTVAKFGGNIVMGHTHRGAIVWQGSTARGRRFCMNVGWLGDSSRATYATMTNRADWEHGIGIVRETNDIAWPVFVPFIHGQALLDGQLFGTPSRPNKKQRGVTL